jgi:deazaflavin-dependent oxidoreductase (nitroreductase family)
MTGLRRLAYAVANGLTTWAIIAGIPRPPYARANALVAETVGRRSGKRRRVPVGYLAEDGKLVVVVEDGLRAHWVRNALAQEGRLRIHLRGSWRPARLRVVARDPEACLRRMNRLHAALVRQHASTPAVVEITALDGA